jgi:hypothetical protein
MRISFRIAVVSFFVVLLGPIQTAWSAWLFNGVPIGGNQRSPAIVSDGAGGAIIAWLDLRSDGDIYVRRIDGAGKPLWTAGGVGLCLAINDQSQPVIVSDGAGGAIVAWTDRRNDNGDIYARRIDAAGNPLWTPDGVAVCTVAEIQVQPIIVSDGAGGAIIAWTDNRNSNYDIFARRIDASGNALWASGGVAIYTAAGNQFAEAMVADGAGGAILSWSDAHVLAQRIDSSGNKLWNVNGVSLCTFTSGETEIVSDGASGAIIAWSDYRSGELWPDLYARRINAAGTPLWTADGVAIGTAANAQALHSIVADGAGGAIVAWSDYRNVANAYDIYSQRIDSAGNPLWAANGVPLCTSPGDQSFSTIVSDGASGAVVTWLDYSSGVNPHIYAQRVAATGGALWAIGGAAVCTMNGDKGELVSTSGGGSVIAAWTDSRNDPTEIYAQRVEFKYGYWGMPEPAVNSVLDVPFDEGGMVEIEWTASQQDIAGGGGVISHYSIWRDTDLPGSSWEMVGEQPATAQPEYSFLAPTLFDSGPEGPFHHFQVIAHAYPALGYEWESNVVDGYSVDNTPTGVGNTPPIVALTVLDNVPNPFASTTTLRIGLPNADEVAIDVFDVAGRRVRNESIRLAAGWAELTFDARDENGRLLPSGVYFYRVRAAGETLTRKFVITR